METNSHNQAWILLTFLAHAAFINETRLVLTDKQKERVLKAYVDNYHELLNYMKKNGLGSPSLPWNEDFYNSASTLIHHLLHHIDIFKGTTKNLESSCEHCQSYMRQSTSRA